MSQIRANNLANSDKFHTTNNTNSAKDAMNTAIDKLMNWLYAPWLIVPIDETPGSGNDVAVYTLSEDERSYFLETKRYYDYRWQQYMVWEFEWSQPQAAKTLSDRVRQIDNAFGNKEVNRRAALAATEDDHFADAGRKWEELSDRLHLHTLFGSNNDKNAKVHWMISQREDALRRRGYFVPIRILINI